MKTERIVLSFIAVIIGLFVAGIAFFFYQSTKTISPSKLPRITVTNPTPTGSQNIPLSIDQPENESVVTTRSITIKGKTSPDATLVVNTPTDDQVVTPAANGNFSITVSIDTDENQIQLTAISPSGDEVRKVLTVTYSTEQF